MNAPGPLDRLAVASPCTVSWNSMSGNDQKRFCAQCKLNVYNLSAMTRMEAEDLIRTSEGRLCGRFYRRRDGTIITADCPDGQRAARRRRSLFIGVAACAAAILTPAVGLMASASGHGPNPIARILDWLRPDPEPIMGEICPSPPAPTP